MVDYGGYERQKGAVDYQYGTDSTSNAYGRFISQQRGNRQLGDMYQGFQRQTPIFKSQFGKRNLAGAGINSGVERGAMQNYLGDFGRDYGRAQTDLTQGLQQYDLNQNNLDAWRNQQNVSIEAQRATDIANEAAQIDWLRQLVGGL